MSVLSALRMERLLRANFIENRLLNDIAERDGLTGLYNRRMFDNLTNRLWLQAQRNQESLQIILVDIDHFKPYNDLYGHQAGDNCIRRVAAIIARATKTAVRLLRALRRRRVRARALRAVRRRFDGIGRADSPRNDGAQHSARALRRGRNPDGQHRLGDRGARHQAQPRRA